MQATLGPDTTRSSAHHNIRAILTRTDFRRLLGARLSSQLGDGLLQAGLAGSVLFNPERATTAMAIAVAFAVLLVPYSVLGPFAGVFLDRWSRRQALVATNGLRAGLAVPTAWLVWHGDNGIALVATTLSIIALNRLFLAGMSASHPRVVDKPRLITANALATTVGSATYSGGLALAVAVFHAGGAGLQHSYAAVVGAAGLCYGLSAAITLRNFSVDALGPDDIVATRTSLISAIANNAKAMTAGLHHLAHRRPAMAIVAVQSAHRCLYGVLAIATLLLYRHYYYTDNDPAASMTGLLPVAVAAATGALLAAMITPPVTRRIGGWRWVSALMVALAVLVPALGLPFHATLTVLATMLVSLATQSLRIVTDTVVQIACHDDFRGRVFSVSDTAMNLMFVAGLFVGALVLPPDGHSALALVALGVAYAALAAWTVLAASHRGAAATDVTTVP